MRGGSLIRNWPVGLVLLVSMAVPLGLGHGSWAAEEGGSYPLRFALPPPGFPDPPDEDAAAPGASDEKPDTAAPAADAAEPERGAPGLPDGFAAAFEGVPSPAATAIPAAAAQEEKGGLTAVRFNLADPYAPSGDGQASGPIELTKGVRVNGAEAGNATIRVTDGATIAIARDQLDKLLSGAGRGDLADKLASAGPFVSFDRIRQAGLNVRYDAASDRILLSS